MGLMQDKQVLARKKQFARDLHRKITETEKKNYQGPVPKNVCNYFIMKLSRLHDLLLWNKKPIFES
jgi:hypothetical protein